MADKIKKGQTIKLYFKCAGVVSEEERKIMDFDKNTVTTDETLHPSEGGGEQFERFDRITGKCLNDNTMFGGIRYIDPI